MHLLITDECGKSGIIDTSYSRRALFQHSIIYTQVLNARSDDGNDRKSCNYCLYFSTAATATIIKILFRSLAILLLFHYTLQAATAADLTTNNGTSFKLLDLLCEMMLIGISFLFRSFYCLHFSLIPFRLPSFFMLLVNKK